MADLHAFVQARNARKLPSEPEEEPFTEDDLTKLAYWMAIGSGKTQILHLNYYQFLHYNREPLDNILLITPNEGLSEQHLCELDLSGIPARRFDLNQSSLLRTPNEIQVLEITKLVEQKRGGGVSVPVEAFKDRNLIFVAEGHKGSGGEVWRRYRDALGEIGFTFEYSATFGQALSAAGDDELTKEYGKAIVFDYSYRYFYGDGFGKDFRILNLRDEDHPAHTEILLLGNLLSFYEQLRLYEEHQDELRPYNLEKPLWVFVGSTVNAVYTKNKKKRSDVLTVVRFFHHVLGETLDLDSREAQRLLAHPLPHWVERMTVSYLQAHGGKAERKNGAWDLTWPSGERWTHVVFTSKEAEEKPLSHHLTLEDPKVRGLAMRLSPFAPGQLVPVITLPGLAPEIMGFWSLWRISISTADWNRRRIMPLFLADDGRVFAPTARHIWDQLVVTKPTILRHLDIETSHQAFKRLQEAAE